MGIILRAITLSFLVWLLTPACKKKSENNEEALEVIADNEHEQGVAQGSLETDEDSTIGDELPLESLDNSD